MAIPGFEIERKYLLDGLPEIPDGAERWQIEQGYLSPRPAPDDRDAGLMGTLRPEDIPFAYGRLRRHVTTDGSVKYTHTLKTGTGLQRAERERVISQDDFERHWPRTEGRRVRKIRWRVPHGQVVWEIDDLEDGWMTLAEVELEATDQVVTPPTWLATHIVREVTDDPEYTNSALAERLSSAAKR